MKHTSADVSASGSLSDDICPFSTDHSSVTPSIKQRWSSVASPCAELFSLSVRVTLRGLRVLTSTLKLLLLPLPSNSCWRASARAWPARGCSPWSSKTCAHASARVRDVHKLTEIVETNRGGPGLCWGARATAKSAAWCQWTEGRRARSREPNCMWQLGVACEQVFEPFPSSSIGPLRCGDEAVKQVHLNWEALWPEGVSLVSWGVRLNEQCDFETRSSPPRPLCGT